MTEDEMFGWHHQLNGHEFEQAPGAGDGQGSLACCSSWGHKELDTFHNPFLNQERPVYILLWLLLLLLSHFSHVRLSLCDPTDCSTPGLPVHHQLLELAQTHVH